MFGISPVQLLIILAIVILIFGTKKLKNIGTDLGGALKGFKNAMGDDEEEKKAGDGDPNAQLSESTEGETIDVEAEKVDEKNS